LLTQLGYATIGDDWGSGGPVPPLLDSHEPGLLELRVLEGHDVIWSRVIDLVASAWVPDPLAGTPRVVAVERSALRGISSGGENIAAALRARAMRYYGPFLGPLKDEREIFDRLAAFLVAAAGDITGEGGPPAAG
jgi:hypothetical protein